MRDQPLEKGGASPLSAYTLLSVTFGLGLLALAASQAAWSGFEGSVSWGDLALIAAATHKITRVLTRERVTMSLRAPFTAQHDEGRGREHHEEPKGHGLQRALGELLTCPYCVAPWIATALIAGHVLEPIPTRVISSVFAVVMVSDFLNHLYAMLEAKRAELDQTRKTLEQVARAEERVGMH